MKKIVTSFLLVLSFMVISHSVFSQCNGTAGINIGTNNIDMLLTNNGNFWFDGSYGQYEVPSGSGIQALFSGSIWMGGIDPGGNLKVAALDYASSGNQEFSPGPLDENGMTNDNTCSDWDRFFLADRYDIYGHRADWEDNMMIDGTISDEILGWPAKGNPNFESIHGFDLPTNTSFRGAPFVDVNQDGIYDPSTGDYPKVKGESNIFWIYNDNGIAHANSGGEPIRMQLNCMVYNDNSQQDLINNTSFYDIETIYFGQETLSDFAIGIWLDPDLGCYSDDFIGSIPDHDMAYVYNGDDNDENCSGVQGYGEDLPVLSVKILKTQNAGGADGMTGFMYYLNQSENPPPSMTDPSSANEFYNLIRNSWRDGTPLSQGGTGFAPGSAAYNFAFDGSDINGSPWKECEIDNAPGDRRMLMNMDMNQLFPGSISRFTFAVIWQPQLSPNCPDENSLVDNGAFVSKFDSLLTIDSEGGVSGPLALFGWENLGGNELLFQEDALFSPVQWDWDFGDGTNGSGYAPINHMYANPDDYNVCLTVTDDNGMMDTYCEVITIVESTLPVANFSFTGTTVFVVDFQDLSTNDPTMWSWDFGDGNTSDLQNPTHTFQEEDVYNVCLTATNADGSDEVCKTVAIISGSLDNLNQKNNISFHPNPVTDFSNIIFSKSQHQQLIISMYDCLGLKMDVSIRSISQGVQLDLQSLVSGIYFVEIRDAAGNLLGGEKLIKH